jgi:hypothetical protein
VGVLVGLVTDAIVGSVVGWLCCGPLAIGLVALFTGIDSKRHSGGWYSPRASATWMRRIAVVLALTGVIVNSVTIAFWVARR